MQQVSQNRDKQSYKVAECEYVVTRVRVCECECSDKSESM